MLNVTEPAKQALSQMLDNAKDADGKAARFITDGQQMQLALDEPQPEDATFELDGRTVLILSPQVNQLLDDKVLDIVHTEQGQGLALKTQAA